MHRKKCFKGKMIRPTNSGFKGLLRKSGQLCRPSGNENMFPVAVVGLKQSELARAGRVLVLLIF